MLHYCFLFKNIFVKAVDANDVGYTRDEAVEACCDGKTLKEAIPIQAKNDELLTMMKVIKLIAGV